MDKRAFLLRVLHLCMGLSVFTGLLAQSDNAVFPPKPEPAVYVHDYSGWLRAEQKSALEQKLRQYWDSTSTQIVVMIRPDLGDYDRATYAIELGNRWGIGRKDKNNGVVMLIKSEAPDRGVFIATGYGAEGGLTDLQAGRIIRNTMAPYFRQQQYYEGIDAGTNEIIQALSGEFTRDGDAAGNDGAAVVLILLLLAFIVFFIFIGVVMHRARKNGEWYTRKGNFDDNFPMGRGGGAWWIGGGGSSGSGWGGGSSGGGSFGGGSFGGGGAGGDW